MACPYFIPTVPHPSDLWPHRYSLPLGDGFTGHCSAQGSGECDDETLRLQCNLGYADCVHLPSDRELDAVRFYVQSERQASDGSTVLRVQFCGERAHLPSMVGELRFNQAISAWIDPPDPRLAALADAAVRVWISSHARSATPASSEIHCDVRVSAESNKE